MDTLSPTPVYDLAFFRSFFADKPAETWTEGQMHNANRTRHCSMGFIEDAQSIFYWHPTEGPMGKALGAVCAPLCDGQEAVILEAYPSASLTNPVDRGANALVMVNNAKDPRYPHPDPRARVLAALDDLIAGTVPALVASPILS